MRGRRHLAFMGLVWGVMPVSLTAFTFASPARRVHFAGDFHYAFWPAARSVLRGMSPYVDPSSPVVTHATAFVYPAVAAVLLAPFGLLPHGTGDMTFAVLNIIAALLTLRVLEVRDWRLYGLTMLSAAVYSGWTLANVSLMLALGLALCWRYRERPAVAGLLTALLVSVKLFLWPLALWLLATRRYAALAYAVAGALALNLAAWALLGFDELARYMHLLRALDVAEEARGFSLVSLARHAGLGRTESYALMLALGAGVCVACVALGRRGRDLAALAIATGLCLLATPIVQLHYFALLAVPLALARPRLSAAWSLPIVMWICGSTRPVTWQIAAALALASAMVAVAVRRRPVARVPGLRSKVSGQLPGPAKLDVGLVPPRESSVAVGVGGR